ncbi:hypothetical protein SAMN05421810_10171 [Amycolatopsis arida]|uniref:Uncharacterized protein n=1 Tax=Amycolatopsis arida TaxID=587909 RepID=A0A1I5KAX3_9PSEU|nr:hypothetical protein [Amycolatopsis arida]TDX96967.1 hypothetical protein CLV69_10269 [Amycolatopsis arida]SFO82204.1 hypothetical protein SAMN05421810_10171 [Amycolatopsis arida]
MGVYSDEPDPPVYYQAVDAADCVRYTDVSQAKWFRDRINFAFGGQRSTNVRMDADGTTIRWFGYYVLRLGDWLYRGNTPITDEVLRASGLRPVTTSWPEDSTVQQSRAGSGA